MQEESILPTKDKVSGLCAHAGCGCSVAAGETYCSDYCVAAEAGEEAQTEGCGCGHPECDAA
jgi:hypothetical protein